MKRASWLILGLLLAASGAVRGQTLPVPLDRVAIDREVAGILDEHGEGIAAGLWIGGTDGGPWYDWKAESTLPTASAIKTSYLVELFAAHAHRLDEPLPGLAAVLGEETHAALAPFDPATRDAIRKALAGASVRRIGAVMMGKEPASNAVYNAAASVTTAVLGGPAALTAKIHARDPEFGPIRARRYMLAPRDRTGDNEASAAALASVLRRIAGRHLKGVDDATLADIRGAIISVDSGDLGRSYSKGGALASDPITRVSSGWWETPRGVIVSVVMTAQPGPGSRPRAEADARLAETNRRLGRAILAHARKVLDGP
jgi:hypothetical protein